jgi:aspartyl aminopeptidase
MTGLAAALCEFVDASPTPFHAVAEVARRLTAAGFTRVEESAAWVPSGVGAMIVRDGTLIAWRWPTSPTAGLRIIGAHTDSPNLRVKQRPDRSDGTLALEMYGGALLESWLDRDLKIAGRVVFAGGASQLIDTIDPIVRVPRLARHLSDDSTALNRQRHIHGIWEGTARRDSFLDWLAAREQVAPIVGFELMTAPTEPSAIVGQWVAAARLDNQATCFAGLEAFLAADTPGSVVALFDHEEVGSTTHAGAESDVLLTTLERITLACGGDREAFLRAKASSICVSGDMAHATHPSFADRHESTHPIEAAGGPVLKVHAMARYATESRGAEFFARACSAAGVPMQRFMPRADLPSGSTIGPLSAARTGILTVDVGAPQLAMHSARETMAAVAVDQYVAALSAVYTL